MGSGPDSPGQDSPGQDSPGQDYRDDFGEGFCKDVSWMCVRLLDTTTGLLDMTIWKVSLKVSDVGCMCLRDVSDYVSCVSDEPYPYPYKVALSL